MMRRTENKEALAVYAQIRSILDQIGTNRLQIEPRLTIKRDGNVISAIWRPYGFSETALCVVDGGDGDPCVVSFRRGSWTKHLQAACESRCANLAG